MANIKYDLPLIPLRDVVVFPGVVTTLFVGRNKSINALNAAMAGEKKIVLAAQKNGSFFVWHVRVVWPLRAQG